MNITEQLLRETLHSHVHDAPLVTSYEPRHRLSRRHAAKWVVPIAVAAIAAGVVGGVAWIDRQDTTSDVAPAVSNPLDLVEGLTGPAVAEALGLQGEPNTDADLSCATAVAADQNGVRYCLDGVTSDPAARMVIGTQIGGRPRTPSVLPYFRAWLELQTAMESTNSDDPSLYALQDRVGELHEAMVEEARALRHDTDLP